VDTLPAFLGRLHPLWVHLPIGILVLLGILELVGLASRLPGLSRLPALGPGQRALVLALGALAAAVAALLGWMLARTGDYDQAAVAHHRVLGIAAAGAALAALAVHRLPRVYLPVLAVSLGLLAAAGHAGGSITHGGDFLTARMPAPLAKVLGIAPRQASAKPRDRTFADAAVFADAVQPILRDRCVGCHGPEKSNGGLRLDSWEALSKGGKHGAVLKPGSAGGGMLLSRIDLPRDEKEHMPPRGRPQLSDDELAVLEWWASSGAAPDRALASLDLPPPVEDVLRQRLGGPQPEAPPPRAATLEQARQIARRLGILVRSVSPDGPWIDVTASRAGRAFGDAELARLAPVASAVQWLDVAGTSVSDKGMATVAAMRSLERLHLDGTQVTDEGLRRLGRLRRLTYLNLRGTAVTDAGIAALRGMPRLRSLYVWQTAVTPAAVEELGRQLVDARKISRWNAERDVLGREIDAEHFEGNTGEALRIDPPPASANPTTPSPLPK